MEWGALKGLTEPTDATSSQHRVARLLRLMGLMAVYPAPRLSQPAEQAVRYPYLLRGLSIERINQVWSTDITYIRLARGFLYLMAIMDWFSRYVLAWRTSITLETAFCPEALEQAFERARPEIFNNDQGSQFTSTAFTSRLQGAGVRISWMAAAEHWIIFSSNGSGEASNMRRCISRTISRSLRQKVGSMPIFSSIITSVCIRRSSIKHPSRCITDRDRHHSLNC